MADDAKKLDDIEQQTSMGSYLLKQAYQQVVSLGSVIGGGYAGLLVGKVFSKTAEPPIIQDAAQAAAHAAEKAAHAARWKEFPILSKLPGLKERPTKTQGIGGIVGAVAGALLAGIILGYEHWKKIKQSQLQVDEITKDVSDIEVFKKTDPELKAENQRLWAELKKREHSVSSSHDKHPVKKPEFWTSTLDSQASENAELAR